MPFIEANISEHIEHLREIDPDFKKAWDESRTEDEPNATTYKAIEAAEKDKDISGPFDNVTDLMEELNT